MTDPAGRRASRSSATLPPVSSRQLAAVLAVAEYRSFIAAAAHLGISQPALTLAIKRLEQTLGLPLFQRSTRHVATTAAGREFVTMAERVLNDLRLGVRSMRELSERRRGQVIVASLIQVRISDVVAEYRRRFPEIEIQLREGFHEGVKDDVRSGLADFGIANLGEIPASYLAESLGLEPLWVVMHDGHPLARKRQVEFKTLRDVPLVSLPVGSETRRLIDAAAAAAGFTLHHVVTVALPATLLNLVAAGVGAAVTPARRPPWAASTLVSRPLIEPRLSSKIGIIRLADRELSPAAAGLMALVRQRLRIRRS